MSKGFSGSAFERRPSHPPKKNVPSRPAPPPYSSGQGTPGHSMGPSGHVVSRGHRGMPASLAGIAAFGSEAEQLEWAKRESERAEQERMRRLRQQEQEDLELAIALSKTLT
ncbi:epidermal growth factor receptor substrate 15-like 1 isoform X1 [Clupea harengus]|uniref:Epidermal growth factor receptor substrate 15-like 1 isoform X1 n=1 Tax=Clupea harengus TaxID=7950 RepID=A0A8M1K545_CLUHA|nr:epidermal growth factor receptor substrate 15-like 1 isoform X1 [Clupea harengus]